MVFSSFSVIAYSIILLLISGIAIFFFYKWRISNLKNYKKRIYRDLKRYMISYVEIATELAKLFRKIQVLKTEERTGEEIFNIIDTDHIDNLYQQLKQMHILIETRLSQLSPVTQGNLISTIRDFLFIGPIEQLGVRDLEDFVKTVEIKMENIFVLMN